MKKLITLLLVLMTVVTLTGCDFGTSYTVDDTQYCVEKTVIAGPDVNYIGMRTKYETEYLRETGCKNVETCQETVYLNVTECF